MEINEIRDEVHELAQSKGFWDDYDTLCRQHENTPLGASIKQAYLSQKLMLATSELGEAMEALRKDEFANIKAFERGLPTADGVVGANAVFEIHVKNTFEDELADTIIRLLDMAGKLGIDVDKHIAYKTAYNSRRPYKHGRNF